MKTEGRVKDDSISQTHHIIYIMANDNHNDKRFYIVTIHNA